MSDVVTCEYEHYNLDSAPRGLARATDGHSYDRFATAADALYQALAGGETVLTHCHSGTSRSVAVAAAALARRDALQFDETLQTIKDARETAEPSELYREHAQEYINTYCTQTH